MGKVYIKSTSCYVKNVETNTFEKRIIEPDKTTSTCVYNFPNDCISSSDLNNSLCEKKPGLGIKSTMTIDVKDVNIMRNYIGYVDNTNVLQEINDSNDFQCYPQILKCRAECHVPLCSNNDRYVVYPIKRSRFLTKDEL